MKIYAFEAYYGGSHKSWLDQFAKHSTFDFEIFTMPARHWKWRMHGSALHFAANLPEERPDLILTSDMTDCAVFASYTRKKFPGVPLLAYFHENQFGYPWSDEDKEKQSGREYHYQFINISSALSADRLIFNSCYHRDMFCSQAEDFLRMMPDFKISCREKLITKSTVLYPGISIEVEERGDSFNPEELIFIWNHRREYDKNPGEFERFLHLCAKKNYCFKLILLGAASKNNHPVFERIEQDFGSSILFNGYAKDKKQYVEFLSMADFAPVFSNQDYFGISIMECCAAGVIPLLPERLSYPELYGDIQGIFHDGAEDALEIVKNITPDKKAALSRQVRNLASHFQWPKLIDSYDSFLTIAAE